MSQNDVSPTERPEPRTDIYLPAVTLPPNFGRLERIANDLFDFHGIVRMPRRLGK